MIKIIGGKATQETKTKQTNIKKTEQGERKLQREDER